MTTSLKLLLIGAAIALVIEASMVPSICGSSESEPVAEARLGPDYVGLPIGRILLVQTGSAYCAIRFTKTWTGEPGDEFFARYESFYQGDGSGDLSKKNVKFMRGNLWRKKPIGIGRLWLISRFASDIRCGPVTLSWGLDTNVYFVPGKLKEEQKDIRFAPTIWTDISEVNVRDPRVKWYRPYDIPVHTQIPIDQLWGDKTNRGVTN